MKNSESLNLQLTMPSLAPVLAGIPHILTDAFGQPLSSEAPQQADQAVIEIMAAGACVAKLQTNPAFAGPLSKALGVAFEKELHRQIEQNEKDGKQLLSADLDSLLGLAMADSFPITDLLRQLLRLLRAHIWVKEASIFGMLDGFTLEGLVAVGRKSDDWKTLYASAAGAAASNKKPYLAEDPARDPLLLGRAGLETVENLVCFPLVHGPSVVGVMNIASRVGGAFTPADIVRVTRFANVATTLLQKHILKTRMEDYERTSDHLGKYLSQKVVKNVEAANVLHLGGVEKKVVCLFSDIRGFTNISESIPPATLVQLLNFHFEKMHAIIEKYEGTLDKIVGDLIMALWNVPKDQPEPELLAMKAAIEMQKEMIRIVIPEWQRHGVEKVGMGIGVNAGLAVLGNLGSSRLMNYTVIGDAINTAQRLESKAKAGEIWMNEEMYPIMHGKLEKPLRREKDIQLKGRQQTINALVYQPLTY